MGRLLRERPHKLKDGLYRKKVENGMIRAGKKYYEVASLLDTHYVFIRVIGPDVCLADTEGAALVYLEEVKERAMAVV